MQAKKDNVIRFPDRKQEPAQPVTQPPPVPQPTPPQSAPLKPAMKKKAAFALVAIVGLSLMLNRYSPEKRDLASAGRGLASVGTTSVLPEERDANWDRAIAKELLNRSGRDLASLSVGRQPSAEDRLRFDVLRSQYALIMENGKISEIRSPNKEGSVYVMDGSKFLIENQSLMPVQFTAAVSDKRVKTDGGIQERFALLNDQKRNVGTAVFGMDRFGRLLSFTVTSTSVE